MVLHWLSTSEVKLCVVVKALNLETSLDDIVSRIVTAPTIVCSARLPSAWLSSVDNTQSMIIGSMPLPPLVWLYLYFIRTQLRVALIYGGV